MGQNNCCRIALTGGPGGGKTTAVDLFRRELGESVVVVPEAATLLYLGGFPRGGDQAVREVTQRAIYHVQRNLEDVQAAHYKSRILLCDRGTVDGAAYWPGRNREDFFLAMGSSYEAELARYDGVIFFETAAVGGVSIEGGNPARTESLKEALALDRRLHALWEKHPRFVHVPHDPSFLRKISQGLRAISKMVRSNLSEPPRIR
ncbi:MAG: AAA family ATPase [Bdellovibrionales bacterium]|nr:AAA family ATPase [Bdellovibrionales bacterium]